METPKLNFNHWLKEWNKAIGNAVAYSNKNIAPWSSFQGTLNECETEILKITTKQNPSDSEIFKVIDLINQWGGKTSRMFYTIRRNQTASSREQIMNEPNLSYYKEGVRLSKDNNFNAVNSFIKVNGIGASFMGKHATFWSNFNMVIIDNKIAGVLGFNNPNLLLAQNNYNEFMSHINNIKISNKLETPVNVERSLFSFHNNYFDNNNTRFKNNIIDFTDLNYAIYIAEKLNIPVPLELKNRI